jgi:hypothetical protein
VLCVASYYLLPLHSPLAARSSPALQLRATAPPEERPKGHLKKRNGRPRTRTSAEPIQKAPTHLLFFLFFPEPVFFIEFSGVSQGVEFKNTTKKLKKVDVESVLKKMRKIPFRFFLGEREPLSGLILIEATYRNGIHSSH